MEKVSVFVALLVIVAVLAEPVQAQSDVIDLSLVGITGLVGFDILTALASARRFNRKQLQVSPAVNLYDGSVGLAMRFSFNRAPPLHPGYFKQYTLPVLSFERQEKRKSPEAAFLLSLGATVVPIAVGLAYNANVIT